MSALVLVQRDVRIKVLVISEKTTNSMTVKAPLPVVTPTIYNTQYNHNKFSSEETLHPSFMHY